MKDPILLNKMWREVEAGRVSVSQSGSLSLFKYTQETHIKNQWNEVNRLARGIIFDVDGTIVARPFSKFFNLGEVSEAEPKNFPWKEGMEVYEKIDGSCGIGYRLNGQWRLATPGSMESEQAIEGTRMLNDIHGPSGLDRLQFLPIDCTPVFEIIYPENRIVVDYNGVRELVLLAMFEHNGTEWHPRRVDQIAFMCGFRRPKRYDISPENLRAGDIPFEDNEEGYVVCFGNGFRVKVKSPRYLQIHRLLDRCSPKGVVELIRGREYGSTLARLPRELVLRFDDIRAHVQGLHDAILAEAGEYYRNLMESVGENRSRKDYAMWIQGNVPNAITGLVFGMMDGKDLEESIWKMVIEKVNIIGT